MDKLPYSGAGWFCDRCLDDIKNFDWFDVNKNYRVVQGPKNIGYCLCEICTKELGEFMSEMRRPFKSFNEIENK